MTLNMTLNVYGNVRIYLCVRCRPLTVVHAEDDGRTEKSADCLEEEVHGKLPPALSSKQAQGKSHSGVQMAACEEHVYVSQLPRTKNL